MSVIFVTIRKLNYVPNFRLYIANSKRISIMQLYISWEMSFIKLLRFDIFYLIKK